MDAILMVLSDLQSAPSYGYSYYSSRDATPMLQETLPHRSARQRSSHALSLKPLDSMFSNIPIVKETASP